MIEYLILLGLAIFVYFYYSFVFKPKKLYDFYANTMESLGYKVQKLSFKPFRAAFIDRYQESFQKYKDSFYFDKNNKEGYDFVLHNIMDQITIDLANPDMIREFLSMQKIFIFPKKKIYIANLKRLIGEGVAFSEGQTWKSKRKIVSSVFTFDFLKSIIPNISKICDQQFEKAQKNWKVSNPGTKDFQFYMLEIGFNIFSSVMMISFFGMESTKLTIQGKSLCQFITEGLKLADSQATELLGYILGSWIFNLGLKKRDRKVNHIIKVFRNFATALVKQKIEYLRSQKQVKSDHHYSDIIQALFRHYHLGSQVHSGEQKYNIENVIDQFCTLLAAGTDTTSHFFMMIVYYVIETPEVQSRLRKQIDQVFKTQDDMTYQNLKKMKYIDCIQEEVTRIYGPTTGVFLRQAIKDTQLLNLPIKKGTSLSLKPIFNHYSSELFQDPQKFKPERWQKPNDLHPYTIMGFSGGPRSCLGKHLAMLETKIALVKLLRRYKTIKLSKHISEWEIKFQFLPTLQKFMTVLEK